MSTRGTILNTLATELLKITVANGYVSNVKEVRRDVPHSDELPYSGPDKCLTIIDAGPDVIDQYCGSGKIRATMRIHILAQVMAILRTAVPVKETNDIIADVRKAVHAPIALGANCRYVSMGDIPEVWIEERKGIAVIPIYICYWYTGATP
jgi:hypothetical protein